MLSLHSNGYINIISPASCPVTDILMIRCRARTAPGKDLHSVRGPARAVASLGAGSTRQSPPRGAPGEYLGGKALGQTPRTQTVFSPGAPWSQEPLPEMEPHILGSPIQSMCGSLGSVPEPGTHSQTLAPRKTLPLAFTQASILQTHRSER